MAVGDPSREDAAADAGSARRVDDHGVALDAAIRVDVADVEKAALVAEGIFLANGAQAAVART